MLMIFKLTVFNWTFNKSFLLVTLEKMIDQSKYERKGVWKKENSDDVPPVKQHVGKLTSQIGEK